MNDKELEFMAQYLGEQDLIRLKNHLVAVWRQLVAGCVCLTSSARTTQKGCFISLSLEAEFTAGGQLRAAFLLSSP